MTKIIGITGGMGSGKSTVCSIFASLGAPVYNADERAKYLMRNSFELISSIKAHFGEASYDGNNQLNRAFLADIVFKNPKELKHLNSLVHPAVFEDFHTWKEKQDSEKYVIKEAAIMFESGSFRENDINIVVTCPLELRIARIQKRDRMDKQEILARINNQMPEKELVALCDEEIKNNEEDFLIPQILKIHRNILDA